MKYILLNLLILISVVIAQENIVKELQQKYKSINDFSADLNIGKEIQKFYFKKPSNIRIEMKSGLIVSDGKTSWNYNKKKNQVIASKVEDNTFTPEYYLFNLPVNSDVKTEKDGDLTKVTFSPKGDNSNFSSLIIWVNSNTLISRLILNDATGNSMTVSFSHIKINTNLSDNTFQFSPPKGVKLIDLR